MERKPGAFDKDILRIQIFQKNGEKILQHSLNTFYSFNSRDLFYFLEAFT